MLAVLQASGVDGKEARFGHFFNRVAQAFAPQAGVLHAAVRHVIDPESRHFTDHQAAHFQCLEGPRDALEIAREDAGLQAELGAIQRVKRSLDRKSTRLNSSHEWISY